MRSTITAAICLTTPVADLCQTKQFGLDPFGKVS